MHLDAQSVLLIHSVGGVIDCILTVLVMIGPPRTEAPIEFASENLTTNVCVLGGRGAPLSSVQCRVASYLPLSIPQTHSQYMRWARKQGSSHVTTCLGCITTRKAMPVLLMQKRGKARGSSILKSASRVYKPSSCMANAVSLAIAELNLATTGPTSVLLVRSTHSIISYGSHSITRFEVHLPPRPSKRCAFCILHSASHSDVST